MIFFRNALCRVASRFACLLLIIALTFFSSTFGFAQNADINTISTKAVSLDTSAVSKSSTDSKIRPQFRYAVTFKTMLDNLEDSEEFFGLPTRTIVGSTLTPMVGVQYGNHSLMGGVFLYKRYGSKNFVDEIEPRIYYQYKDSRFTAVAGLFSKELMKPTRLFHYTSSYKFIKNTVHGFLGQYTTETGYLEAMIDWYKADYVKRLDGFVFRFAGEKYFGNWFINGEYMYHHRADDEFFQTFKLFDRMQYDFLVGYDFTSLQKIFKSIYLTVGFVGDADQRTRDGVGLEVGMGFEARFNLDWKGLYINNLVYVGTPQMRYFKEFGTEIYYGNPFYQSAFLDQLSFGYSYNYKWISVGAHALFFFSQSPKVTNQQLLSVTFALDEVVASKRKR